MTRFDVSKTSILFAVFSCFLLPSRAVAQDAASTKPALVQAKPLDAHAETTRAIVAHYAKIVHATYADLALSTQKLKSAIDSFVAEPTALTHQAAKVAWIESRKVYGLTEAFRFYGGPIDDPKNGPEGLMNAWPVDESYIDGVKGKRHSGYINDLKAFPVLNREVLLSLNEKDGEKNISTGYHAIEFLLWGQDFSSKSPGKRPFSDFIDNGKNNAPRRAQTLVLLTSILNEHAQLLEKEWVPSNIGNYAARFLALPPEEAMQKILTGVATLSIDELAGERMMVALSKKDQENEQSCFSDTTTDDLVASSQGIKNVYSGVYGSAQGPGLRDLLSKTAPELSGLVGAQIEKSVSLLQQVPKQFDVVIVSSKQSPGRKTAEAAIESLESQGKLFARIAKQWGLEINVQE
jgi:putative iron-regulated protein